MKFPLYERVLVDRNDTKDFYIFKCDREWYVEAYPTGSLDPAKKSMAGFDTLRQAKSCVEAWKGWMK